jgi:hypothetical protein
MTPELSGQLEILLRRRGRLPDVSDWSKTALAEVGHRTSAFQLDLNDRSWRILLKKSAAPFGPGMTMREGRWMG